MVANWIADRPDQQPATTNSALCLSSGGGGVVMAAQTCLISWIYLRQLCSWTPCHFAIRQASQVTCLDSIKNWPGFAWCCCFHLCVLWWTMPLMNYCCSWIWSFFVSKIFTIPIRFLTHQIQRIYLGSVYEMQMMSSLTWLVSRLDGISYAGKTECRGKVDE